MQHVAVLLFEDTFASISWQKIWGHFLLEILPESSWVSAPDLKKTDAIFIHFPFLFLNNRPQHNLKHEHAHFFVVLSNTTPFSTIFMTVGESISYSLPDGSLRFPRESLGFLVTHLPQEAPNLRHPKILHSYLVSRCLEALKHEPQEMYSTKQSCKKVCYTGFSTIQMWLGMGFRKHQQLVPKNRGSTQMCFCSDPRLNTSRPWEGVRQKNLGLIDSQQPTEPRQNPWVPWILWQQVKTWVCSTNFVSMIPIWLIFV